MSRPGRKKGKSPELLNEKAPKKPSVVQFCYPRLLISWAFHSLVDCVSEKSDFSLQNEPEKVQSTNFLLHSFQEKGSNYPPNYNPCSLFHHSEAECVCSECLGAHYVSYTAANPPIDRIAH